MEYYSDVLGQLHAKRALVIAAARMHNILLIHKSVKLRSADLL
ncbi:ATP-binding protein [Paenibacillus sp. BT-177]|nr:ATP-binding protein [Paenibacillus sp. BT-177]